MWQFLRRQRSALLWSVALHLVMGALLLMSARFTSPKINPDARPRVVKARLVEIPPTPLLPKANVPDDAARQAADTARAAAAQRQQIEEAARRAAEREQQIEQQRQAAELKRQRQIAEEADAARAAAAQRDAEAAAKRLAVEQARQVEQQRQAAATELKRQRQIAEEAEIARAAAEREAEIARAEAAQRQQIEEAARRAAEREQQIEQQRQAAEIARMETERQQQIVEEAERMAAVETQRFAEDLAQQQQHEQDREEDLLTALESEQLTREADRFIPAIRDRVRQFWIRPPATNRDLVAIVSLRLIPGGDVVPNSVRIVDSSGNASFDQSVLAAVYQASPLPVPAGAAFERFRDFDFTFSAE